MPLRDQRTLSYFPCLYTLQFGLVRYVFCMLQFDRGQWQYSWTSQTQYINHRVYVLNESILTGQEINILSISLLSLLCWLHLSFSLTPLTRVQFSFTTVLNFIFDVGYKPQLNLNPNLYVFCATYIHYYDSFI